MLKFIAGIFLLQAITIALVLIAPADLKSWGWLRLVIPVLIIGLLTAFWFSSIAALQRRDEISRLRELHAKERENILVKAESAKTKLEKDAQRKILREVRRSTKRADIKNWGIFGGTAAVGGLLILSEFLSVGLLILSCAGGAIGGYLLRIRLEKGKLQLNHKDQDVRYIIKTTSNKTK